MELLREINKESSLMMQYLIENHSNELHETVKDLIAKMDHWLTSPNPKTKVSPEDFGKMVAGLSMLTGPNRNEVSPEDLKSYKVSMDLHNVQVLSNVDVNGAIRSQIIRVGEITRPEDAKIIARLVQTPDGRERVKNGLLKIERRMRYINQMKQEKLSAEDRKQPGLGIRQALNPRAMDQRIHTTKPQRKAS